ncbi:MAG: hypothetical protein M3P18_08090, partial [Actinomycetota bacterium]|nr:hypothetical protein [Actinomycetota bacterium]
MLTSSGDVLFARQFRLPVTQVGNDLPDRIGRIGRTDGPGVYWRRAEAATLAREFRALPTLFNDGHSTSHEPPRSLGSGWRRANSIWRRSDGSAFLPFDPNALVEGILSERYVADRSGRARPKLESVAQATYYALRPLLPRTVQMSFRRGFRRVQDNAAFPRWPTETVLHDLCQILLGLLDEVAGEPIPRLAAWPADHSWAFVLTHDVETATGYR